MSEGTAMSIPRSTVKQLHAALDVLIGVGHGDREVQVWLPGTYIAVDPVLITKSEDGAILIEGNVISGGFG